MKTETSSTSWCLLSCLIPSDIIMQIVFSYFKAIMEDNFRISPYMSGIFPEKY